MYFIKGGRGWAGVEAQTDVGNEPFTSSLNTLVQLPLVNIRLSQVYTLVVVTKRATKPTYDFFPSDQHPTAAGQKNTGPDQVWEAEKCYNHKTFKPSHRTQLLLTGTHNHYDLASDLYK